MHARAQLQGYERGCSDRSSRVGLGPLSWKTPAVHRGSQASINDRVEWRRSAANLFQREYWLQASGEPGTIKFSGLQRRAAVNSALPKTEAACAHNSDGLAGSNSDTPSKLYPAPPVQRESQPQKKAEDV